MIEFMDKNKIMGLTQREVKERQALGKSLNEMSLPFLTL